MISVPSKKKFGPLQALERNPDAEICIVLLHGFGANANDLYPLSDIPLSPQFRWIFPEAPHQVQIGPGMFGRTWFPFDLSIIEEAINQKDFHRFYEEYRDAIQSSADGIKDMLKALQVPAAQLILGGFSHGAILSTHICLNMEESLLAINLFSGSYVKEYHWDEVAFNQRGMPFFQSHGKSDPLLPFEMAKELYNCLDSGGLNGEFVAFDGGHEIPLPALNAWQTFLNRLISE